MAFDGEAMKKRFQSAGNRFVFFMAIEYYKPQICEGIAKGLKGITPDKFNDMVDNLEFFTIPPEVMEQIAGWKKQAKWIKTELVGEIFAGARPDLAEVLMKKDTVGGIWLIKLHEHLLKIILTAEEVQDSSKQEMVTIKCTSCGQSFPYAKKDFLNLKNCILCGADVNAPDKLEPAETKLPESPQDNKPT
jgi:hypothetical protein